MKKIKKSGAARLLLFCLLAAAAFSWCAIDAIPARLVLFEQERAAIGGPVFDKLFTLDVAAGQGGVLHTDGSLSADTALPDGVLAEGSYTADVKFLRLLPVKTVRVDVVKSTEVVPCGSSIGVKLYTDGLLVVGLSDFQDNTGHTVSPGKDCGVRIGDVIRQAGGKPVTRIAHFTDAVSAGGGSAVELLLERDGRQLTQTIQPRVDAADGQYKLGLWVRDSTAGIGTLTFYDPATNAFGALGHGITDVDTGSLLPVGSGQLLPANIVSVKRGEKGAPGELRGVFSSDSAALGDIYANTNQGIYGKLDSAAAIAADTAYPIAARAEVREGPAEILCNIHGQQVERYQIEIQRLMRGDTSGKCMVIQVTDPALLAETGGIVQGMSGSPILQNGKAVGAVTHVFINDPTRGYGIFLDAMYKNSLQYASGSS